MPEEENLRLDKWLLQRWAFLPYEGIQKALRKGYIRLEGIKALGSSRVTAGQHISIDEKWLHALTTLYAPAPMAPLPPHWGEKILQWILYEDDDLLVINKPAGIASQGGTGQSLSIDRLLEQWGQTHRSARLRLVHRLDKETSGVMLLAKTLACAQHLTEAFRNQRIRKTYWGLVHGVPPQPQGCIDHPLRRHPVKGSLAKMEISMEISPGLTAVTKYRQLAVYQKGQYAKLALFPYTGRMHQLRVHLQSVGCPLIGDKVYGPPSTWGPLQLHCVGIEFIHQGQPLELKAPPPVPFIELEQQLSAPSPTLVKAPKGR